MNKKETDVNSHWFPFLIISKKSFPLLRKNPLLVLFEGVFFFPFFNLINRLILTGQEN